MTLRRSICFILLALISISRGFSQSVEIDRFSRFINFTVQSGLSHNTVNDIVQDYNGFIWFATENGLSRYDGYSFVNFFHNPEDDNTIPGNSVITLAIDSKNYLWVGTAAGLCRINLDNGNVDHFQTVIGKSNTPRTNHIRKLYFSDRTQKLWIETLGGVLTSLDINTNEWEHFAHEASSQPYYRYHSLYEDSEGYLWVGGRNTPIIRFDTNNQTMHAIYASGLENGGKRDNDLADIFESSRGSWYVMGLDGIYEFFPETEKFSKVYSSSTYSVTEDKEGQLWFGSGYGLLKFDEVNRKFIAYRNSKDNPHSIVHSHINKVFIDRTGNIWAGTREGVSLLRQRSKGFDYYFHIPGDEHSLSSNEVTALAQDTDGTIYVGTADHGMSILKPGENEFKQIVGEFRSDSWLSSDRIRSLYFDSKGMLWVGLWSGVGFNSYNPLTQEFKRYAIDYESFRSDWYNAFLEDSQHNFIAGVWGAQGAMYFDRETGKFTGKHYITYNKPYHTAIKQIMHDGTGNYFITTRRLPSDVYHYSSITGKYTLHRYNADLDDALAADSKANLPFAYTHISNMANNGKGVSIFATDNGIYTWDEVNSFQSFYKGLCKPIDAKISHDNSVFLLEEDALRVFDSFGNQQQKVSIPTNTYRALRLINSKSLLLVGEKELYIGPASPEIDIESFAKISLHRYGIINFTEISQNYLWVSTSSGLIRLCLDETESFTLESCNAFTILDIPVTYTLTLSENQLVAFSPLGVYLINSDTGESNLVPFMNIPEGFSPAILTAALFDNNTIWVGTEAGHYQIRLNTGEIIDTNLPDSYRVSSHLTSSLMEDRNGDIWVGTTNMGLNRINRATGYIKHFYAPELPSNYVNATLEAADGKIWVATQMGLCYIVDDFVVVISNIPSQLDVRSLIEDDQGLIWAGTNNGLLVVDPSTYSIKIYQEFHGFPSTNFSKACIKLNNGRFAFGTSKGVVIFDPNEISRIPSVDTEVSFTHFDVFDHPQEYFIAKTDTVVLNHKQNFFTINFSAAEYEFGEGTTYYYMLQNIDPTWAKTHSHSVSYTNVPPGRYTFRITKMLSNGTVSNIYSDLTIAIRPAWWQTLWFKLAITLIVVGGLAAYAYTYIRQLNAARLNVELEQRLLISQMNPHFIFNSLSAIQSFMYRNQPEVAGNYLSSFSRLVRLILENSRSASITIKQEVQTLELYLSLQKLRFPNKFDYSIDVDPSLIVSAQQLPPMLAQPFIENSIEHGIMHMDGKGYIQVQILSEGGNLKIIVEDNGVGVEKSKEINRSKRFSHTSYATSITQERIKGYSKRNQRGAEVKIINLTEQGKQGTRVEITIPTRYLNNDTIKTNGND